MTTLWHDIVIALIASAAGLITALVTWAKQRTKVEASIDKRWASLCDQQQERLEQMTKQLSAFQKRLGEQEDEIARLWTRLHQSEVAGSVKDTKIVALEASSMAKDLRIATLEGKITELEGQVRALQQENKTLREAT